MTKRETLNYIIENYGKDEIVKAFATHELELIDKKNSNRGNKVNEENIKLTDIVVEEIEKMTTEEKTQFTVTEILKGSEVLANYVCENGKIISTSKLTAILQKEIEKDNARVVNVKDKKVSLYSVVR